MGAEHWVALGAILTAVAALVGHYLLRPKIRAEARKLNSEADDTIAARLTREIRRLDGELNEVREQFATFRTFAADREHDLERENKRLRGEVRRLTKRVDGLENILKLHGEVTPEMQALIDELDRRTTEGNGK